MATYDKKGGVGTSCFKPIENVHETQFVGSRDKGKANVGDIWEILNVCPGDEIEVVTTVMKANTIAGATMKVGDTTSDVRYEASVDLSTITAPSKSATTYFQAIDDKIILTFGGVNVEDAEFAVQVRVKSFVAEQIFAAGGEAR